MEKQSIATWLISALTQLFLGLMLAVFIGIIAVSLQELRAITQLVLKAAAC